MSVVCKTAFSGDESMKKAMTPVLNCMKFQSTVSVDVCVFGRFGNFWKLQEVSLKLNGQYGTKWTAARARMNCWRKVVFGSVLFCSIQHTKATIPVCSIPTLKTDGECFREQIAVYSLINFGFLSLLAIPSASQSTGNIIKHLRTFRDLVGDV